MAENKENVENVKKSKKVDGRYRCFLGSIYNVQNSKVLVAENIISRKPALIEMGTSFKPFYVVKAVVNASNVATPGSFAEPLKASSKEGFDVGCFFSWTSTIVDPIKYVYSSDNVGKIFDALLLQGLKNYIKERDYVTLSKKNFDINAKGAAEVLKKDLEDFEQKYGIRINEIRLTDIIPPREYEEASRQREAQRAENERRLLETKNENERRELEAQSKLKVSQLYEQIATHEGVAKANSLREIQKSNLTPQEAANYDIESRYADKTQTVIRNSGNNGFTFSVNPTDDKTKTR